MGMTGKTERNYVTFDKALQTLILPIVRADSKIDKFPHVITFKTSLRCNYPILKSDWQLPELRFSRWGIKFHGIYLLLKVFLTAIVLLRTELRAFGNSLLFTELLNVPAIGLVGLHSFCSAIQNGVQSNTLIKQGSWNSEALHNHKILSCKIIAKHIVLKITLGYYPRFLGVKSVHTLLYLLVCQKRLLYLFILH